MIIAGFGPVDVSTNNLWKSVSLINFQWVSDGFGGFHRTLTHFGDLARLTERTFSLVTRERTLLTITNNSVAPIGVGKSKIRMSDIWKIIKFRNFHQISMYQFAVPSPDMVFGI